MSYSQSGSSFNRVSSLLLRYWYLLRGSWPRILEMLYWPTVELLLWGYLQLYLNDVSNFFAQAGGVLIGAVLLWGIIMRGQMGFSVAFLEEIWSRNLGHLLISPIRPYEFVLSMMLISLMRILVGLLPVSIMAIILFSFNIFDLGFPLILFFVTLSFTSWSLGLFVTGLIFKYGLGAESLVWTLVFMLLPLCCVYYPVEVLPYWLQTVAYMLPPTYVFEGMRSILISKEIAYDHLFFALALNSLYLAMGWYFFMRMLHSARVSGSILQTGE